MSLPLPTISAALRRVGRALIAVGTRLAHPAPGSAPDAARDERPSSATPHDEAADAEHEEDLVPPGIDPDVWDSYRKEGAPADWLARVASQSPGFLRMPPRGTDQRSVRQTKFGAAGPGGRGPAVRASQATSAATQTLPRKTGATPPVAGDATAATSAIAQTGTLRAAARPLSARGTDLQCTPSEQVVTRGADIATTQAWPDADGNAPAHAPACTMRQADEREPIGGQTAWLAAMADYPSVTSHAGTDTTPPPLPNTPDTCRRDAMAYHAARTAGVTAPPRARPGSPSPSVGNQATADSNPIAGDIAHEASPHEAHREPGSVDVHRTWQDQAPPDADLRRPTSGRLSISGDGSFAGDRVFTSSADPYRAESGAPRIDESLASESGASRRDRATTMGVAGETACAHWPALSCDSKNESDQWRRARRETSALSSLDAEQQEVAWNALPF